MEKGETFLPLKGNVISQVRLRLKKKSSDQLPNTQVLPPFPKLPHFDLRHRFGLQDDIKEEVGKKLACLQEELSLVPFSSH